MNRISHPTGAEDTRDTLAQLKLIDEEVKTEIKTKVCLYRLSIVLFTSSHVWIATSHFGGLNKFSQFEINIFNQMKAKQKQQTKSKLTRTRTSYRLIFSRKWTYKEDK